MLRSFRLFCFSAICFFPCLPATAAEDCPSVKAVGDGFVIENGERSKTEVHYLDDNIVRTDWRFGGKTVLETTEFEGLFQLDRIDRGRRTTLRPATPLIKLFPL